MNNLWRCALRFTTAPAKRILVSKTAVLQREQLSRNIWYMCNSRDNLPKYQPSKLCNSTERHVHSKAEKELVEFLTEEILAERKAQKSKTLPATLDGFKVQLDGAEVTLTKDVDQETVKITFNVNHSVDTDAEPEIHQNMDKPEIGALKSKPSFKVEIIRGNTTLNLVCSFIESDEQEVDVFGLDEISLYDGPWNENVYSVSGEVLDSYLYDLILNYLEEKGISNEFVEKMSEFSTSYEHSAYIGLLEGLSKFASGK